ncbi:pyrroloquinoline quinone biosynthesis protein PqqB [Gluconobacter morbifer]|uniref:Coenzyme PQQ synthesis protein B n=1 Tax=Gluconobacter morbifer G707 TaxID=1088869 RepID=G6XJK4_9PROT|nr:pyrroloquinoline quinone biosynthesis protein PqqB [Gluconobacter morbifer]EHH68109.1 pyrroloquinoline quinone biosynthesis protein PqqB [Gluconobacter morbifer G707]
MIDVIVLGAGAGGGFPQWNSAAPGCVAARTRQGAKPRTQASLAVSADGEHWFILNASPDLRQQIIDTPALHHHGSLRGTPIQGVILSNGEIDAVTGLLTLREREPFTLMASDSTLEQLAANPIFGALDPAIVPRVPLILNEATSLLLRDGTPSGLLLTPFAVPGKAPLYAEAGGSKPDETLGLSITDGHQTVLFVPGCAHITPELVARAEKADLLFFDGTLWRDDEMIRAGLGQKTGQRMGHVSVNDAGGPMEAFASCSKPRKILIHINNSNPILMEDSPERRETERGGWTVGEDGMTFRLGTP